MSKFQNVCAWIGVALIAILLVGSTWYFNRIERRATVWSEWKTPNLGGPEFGQPQIIVPDDWEPQED